MDALPLAFKRYTSSMDRVRPGCCALVQADRQFGTTSEYGVEGLDKNLPHTYIHTYTPKNLCNQER